MSVKTLSAQVSKLKLHLSEAEQKIAKLSEELTLSRHPHQAPLPSGFYLEQTPKDELILHIPGKNTYIPITLPSDPTRAIAEIRRRFQVQRATPYKIDSISAPTNEELRRWLLAGGKVGTDRKLKIEDFNP